ncbi:hypothetical protein BB560_003329 [Smittium megazygosporum]|uniref:Uncharacterized protein n=1 Tax=Smittium megazygosporum TaxID=133381 RepID=A0A2T9ZCC8_9FUNG|nr:hypothetical protein BB560_003329 [Smittium megazygosporum]
MVFDCVVAPQRIVDRPMGMRFHMSEQSNTNTSTTNKDLLALEKDVPQKDFFEIAETKTVSIDSIMSREERKQQFLRQKITPPTDLLNRLNNSEQKIELSLGLGVFDVKNGEENVPQDCEKVDLDIDDENLGTSEEKEFEIVLPKACQQDEPIIETLKLSSERPTKKSKKIELLN